MKRTITILLLLFSTFQLSARCWQNVSAGYTHPFAVKSTGKLALGARDINKGIVFTQTRTSSDSDKIATGYYHVLNTNQDGFIRATGKKFRIAKETELIY